MTNMLNHNKTMISLNIYEIKTHFSHFIAIVRNGETVIICKRNVPIAKIKPIAALPTEKRPIGLAGKEYPGFKITPPHPASPPKGGICGWTLSKFCSRLVNHC
jgi:prevent-host-death family protein